MSGRRFASGGISISIAPSRAASSGRKASRGRDVSAVLAVTIRRNGNRRWRSAKTSYNGAWVSGASRSASARRSVPMRPPDSSTRLAAAKAATAVRIKSASRTSQSRGTSRLNAESAPE